MWPVHAAPARSRCAVKIQGRLGEAITVSQSPARAMPLRPPGGSADSAAAIAATNAKNAQIPRTRITPPLRYYGLESPRVS